MRPLSFTMSLKLMLLILLYGTGVDCFGHLGYFRNLQSDIRSALEDPEHTTMVQKATWLSVYLDNYYTRCKWSVVISTYTGDDDRYTEGIFGGLWTNDDRCNSDAPPDYCADSGGALTVNREYLLRLIPSNEEQSSNGEPHTARLTLLFAASSDGGPGLDMIIMYRPEIERFFTECTQHAQAPIDVTGVAICISNHWWFGRSVLPVPRAIFVMGDTRLAWVASNQGGIIAIEPRHLSGQIMRVVVLPPRP